MAKITLTPLTEDDREQFILDNQYAFKYGAMEEFGQRDDHFEEEGEIISRPRFVRRCPCDDGRMACVAFDDFLPFGHEVRERLPYFRSIVMVGCAAESSDTP